MRGDEQERDLEPALLRLSPLAPLLMFSNLPGAESHLSRLYNRGMTGQLRDGGMRTVVAVFLMRIRLQTTGFIRCSESQGVCLVSTDARTHQQLLTGASWTNLSMFVLIQGQEVYSWIIKHPLHL